MPNSGQLQRLARCRNTAVSIGELASTERQIRSAKGRWVVLYTSQSMLSLTKGWNQEHIASIVRETLDAPARTRFELTPITGRSHQLRVHLQAIGHPILGDALYAPPQVQAMAPRLLLHACALRLTHPLSGEALELRCDPPF